MLQTNGDEEKHMMERNVMNQTTENVFAMQDSRLIVSVL